MWKALVSKSVREVRFVVKQSAEHHGAWNFIQTRLPELRMLNQNTFFSLHEISDDFKTPSACHLIYGDRNGTEDSIPTAQLTAVQFETIFKDKIAYGLTLPRADADASLPVDVVEARQTVRYIDDGF